MDPLTRTVLDAVGSDLRNVADYPDPLARARRAEELTTAVQSLVTKALADVRRDAVAQAVAASSVAVVAEQLGISRARVYALVDGRNVTATTRPRRARHDESAPTG